MKYMDGQVVNFTEYSFFPWEKRIVTILPLTGIVGKQKKVANSVGRIPRLELKVKITYVTYVCARKVRAKDGCFEEYLHLNIFTQILMSLQGYT